jgi:hypothetical protein
MMELLIGERIFNMLPGSQAPSMREDFPSQTLLNKIQQNDMRHLVEKMLKRKPEDRPTAQEILEKVRDVIHGRPVKKEEHKNPVNLLNLNQLQPNMDLHKKFSTQHKW